MTESAAPISLIPPRPNLGPEPWPEPPAAWVGPAVVLGLVLVGLALIGGILGTRRRLRRRRRDAPSPDHRPDGPTTPREELIRRADRLRSRLVERGGPPWAARTTEELATLPDLAMTCGPDNAARLIAFLTLADRAKFAPDEAWDAIAAEVAGCDDEMLEGLLAMPKETGSPGGQPVRATGSR